MAYKLFAPNGNEIKQHDLQDKGPWCLTGASIEEAFVLKYGQELSLAINPEKQTNAYAPDLINLATNKIGDLKTQNTPFFQAQTRYNINPQFAVTFNLKDYLRYSANYPEIEIYFWASWVVTKFEGSNTIEVLPMEGIWFIPFANLQQLIPRSPLHSYVQRVYDDKGNAKSSYVLNLEDPLFTKLV